MVSESRSAKVNMFASVGRVPSYLQGGRARAPPSEHTTEMRRDAVPCLCVTLIQADHTIHKATQARRKQLPHCISKGRSHGGRRRRWGKARARARHPILGAGARTTGGARGRVAGGEGQRTFGRWPGNAGHRSRACPRNHLQRARRKRGVKRPATLSHCAPPNPRGQHPA